MNASAGQRADYRPTMRTVTLPEDSAVGAAAWPPRSRLVTSGKDRVAMPHIVVLAQVDGARVRDHFYLCLGDAASVTPNPEVHARRGLVVPHRPGGALNRGEVVPEDSHRQSPSKADPRSVSQTQRTQGVAASS